MSPVFVDTSAIYALLVRDDDFHAAAAAIFRRLADSEARLVTTSYVLVESYALLQARVGSAAVADLRLGIAPLLDVTWVEGDLHERALDRMLHHDSEPVSLVDAASFAAMRDQSLEIAFTFDTHFAVEGFETLA